MRLVRWYGHPSADYLDQVDQRDRWGRTRRALLYGGAYSRQESDYHRLEAAKRQKFRALAGVVVRDFGPADVPGMRNTYRFGRDDSGKVSDSYGPVGVASSGVPVGWTPFVAEMDDDDAAALLGSVFGVEFGYVDTDDVLAAIAAGQESRQHPLGSPATLGRGPGASGLVLARLLSPTLGGVPPGARVVPLEQVPHTRIR